VELISLQYAAFVIVSVVLYYIIPKKYRWIVLLSGSLFYYVYICKFYVGFILFTIVSTYTIARIIDNNLVKETAVVKRTGIGKQERHIKQRVVRYVRLFLL